MPPGVTSWWAFLCVIATLNVAAWSLAATTLERHRKAMSVQTYAACRMQLALSAAYVFGCAFRSVLPVFDIPRICMFDTWLSDVIVGRSVATIAELCFVGQWALMLNATAREAGSLAGMRVSLLILPLIATAETCSWYAVLTTSNLGHVAENSLWAISVLLVIVAVIAMLPRCAAPRRRVLIAWCVTGVAYVVFMFLVDVPTYWSRYVADEAHGRHYMSVIQGLADVANRRVVSHQWDDWKSEVVWMSLYFSVAVWLSISLTHHGRPRATVYADTLGARTTSVAPQPRFSS
jgi:hypothetical protein